MAALASLPGGGEPPDFSTWLEHLHRQVLFVSPNLTAFWFRELEFANVNVYQKNRLRLEHLIATSMIMTSCGFHQLAC